METEPTLEKFKLKILVADDEPANRDVFKMMLEREGHTVVLVADGVQIMPELSKPGAAFDLVLTDNTMPQKKGLDAIREIRASTEAFKDIKIILVTTDHGTTEVDAKALGAIYLEKPVTYAKLRDTVNTVGKEIKDKK